jgi:hypothetical protein
VSHQMSRSLRLPHQNPVYTSPLPLVAPLLVSYSVASNLCSWRWAYRWPKHVEIFTIINLNCCIKLVHLITLNSRYHTFTNNVRMSRLALLPWWPLLPRLPVLMFANVATDFLVTMVMFVTIIHWLLWSTRTLRKCFRSANSSCLAQ